MVLTYEDLDAIVRGLTLAFDVATDYEMETEPYERMRRKIYAAMKEVKDIEPKPFFSLEATNIMKIFKPSRGLLNLTRTVIECSIGKDKRKELTRDYLEVLSAIVLRHFVFLPAQECNVLAQLYGVGGVDVKPLVDISAELGIRFEDTLEISGSALRHLIEAAKPDLIIAMDNIEKEQA